MAPSSQSRDLAITTVERVVALCMGAVAAFWIAISLFELALRWNEAVPSLGADYWVVRNAAERWLNDGIFYLPEQLAGRYTWPGPWVLYPPTTLLLLVPFVYLPPPVWWILPIGIAAWAIARHRPRPLAWAVILLCLANPTTQSAVFWGNPALWLVAAVALSTHWGWPSIIVLFKPTLFPFALVGAGRRSWWIAAAAAVALSLPLLPMWFEYVTVVRNAAAPGGFLYSTAQVPLMLIPIVAWLGGRFRPLPTARFSLHPAAIFGTRTNRAPSS
jgi:hypothetical protein